MISLNPIAKKIQKRLFQKMKLLGREGNTPNKTVSVGELTHNKLTARSTFVRMISGLEEPVIIMGGELKGRNIAGGYDEIYGPRGEDTNKFKRPIPGIKSINVSFSGGTRALRQADISWTCWSFEDIDRLTPHFLSVGKTVMVEWGWVYDKNSVSQLPTFIDSKKKIKRDAYTDYKNTVIDSNGDFDMMVGIVKNFEFTTREDGGFDCTTTISSMGVNILDNPMPAKEIVPLAVRWDLSSNLTDDEIEEKSKEDNVDKLIKTDVNITLKVLIENIDKYLKDKVDKLNKSTDERFIQEKTIKNSMYSFSGIKNQFIIENISKEKQAQINKTYNVQSTASETNRGGGIVPLSTVSKAAGWSVNSEVKDAWVRWGWFEDNILSKFLTQVSSNPGLPPTAEFRSVNRVEDTDGNQTKELESTRIRNSPHLETIDVNRYILPGQFTPLIKPKIKGLDKRIKGDSDYIRKLSKMVNQNFGKFSAGNKTVERRSYFKTIVRHGDNTAEEGSGPIIAGSKAITAEEYTKGKAAAIRKGGTGSFFREEIEEETVVGKLGFMRNMLINTKVIKEAFGVNEGAVETLNVRECIESLFSLLNQDINFWKFQLQDDEYESYRTKIIDTSITEELPKDGESISSTTNPIPTTKSIYNKTNDEVTNNGVFFFPVWQHNSIVKRQNVTATVPNAMAVSIMYGANADIASTGGDTPAEVGAEEGVAMGKLGTDLDNPDEKNKNLDIVLHQKDYELYGTKSVSDNVSAPTKKGGDDNILDWLKKNPNLIRGNYNEKQQTKDEAIQAQKELDIENTLNKIIDNSLPPPIPTPISNLTDEQWKSLGKVFKEGKEQPKLKDKTLLDLYSSKYDKNNKLKEKFIESIQYNTTLLVTTNSTSEIDKTILLPINCELGIDGIGGIFPSNSFHSTYLPQRYQDNTVFQVFDVNHTVDGSVWTTTINGKMRSSMSRVSTTTTKLEKILDIKTQFAKAQAASNAKVLQEDATAKKVAAT